MKELNSFFYSIKSMMTILRAEFIDKIKKLLNITKDQELSRMFNLFIVDDLFCKQLRSWELLIQQHLRNV